MILLIYFFHNKLYTRKYPRIFYVFGIALLSISCMAVYSLRIPAANLAFCFMAVMLPIRFYSTEEKPAYIFNFFLMIALLFSDIIATVIFDLFIPASFSDWLYQDTYFFISSIPYIILNILLVNLLAEALKKRRFSSLNIFENLFLVIIGVFETLMLFYFIAGSLESGRRTNLMIVFSGIGFLLIICYQLYLHNRIVDHYETQNQLNTEQLHRRLMSSHYKILEEKNRSFEKMKHDINKHLHTITKLIEEEDLSLVHTYAAQIQERMGDYDGPFIFKNKVLQIIINEMYHKCREDQISFTIKVEDHPLDFIDIYDLNTMLNNLLENAFEACMELEEEQRYITVRLYEYSEMIILNVENSSVGQLLKKSGRIISTKKNHSGIGLQNVKYVVEKYSGFLKIDDKESFIVKITLPVSDL